MQPHTQKRLHATASLVLALLLFAGFVFAYGAAGAGMLGLLSSSRVALFTLSGAAISFVGIVGYFLLGDTHIKPHG